MTDPCCEAGWVERIVALLAQRDRYHKALTLIAQTDPVDAILDPGRALRVAASALESKAVAERDR